MLQPVQFIRSTITEAPSNFMHPQGNDKSKINNQDNIASEGLSVRRFYEDLTLQNDGEPTGNPELLQASQSSNQSARCMLNQQLNRSSNQSTTSALNQRSQKSSSSKSFESVSGVKKLKISDFLQSAAENDSVRLSEYITRNFDLNCVDMFGWTALMCAAQKGSFDAVRLLVISGADFTRKNSKNQNAADLATLSRQDQIASYLRELENYEVFDTSNFFSKNEKKMSSSKNEETFTEPFFCPTCEITFQETSPEEHKTSILHQIHGGPHAQIRTVYGLPESNLGFRLLRKNGWNSERGLGAAEDGRKFPIATIFKRNRLGLGGGAESPRVTHFPHLLKKEIYKPADGATTKKDLKLKLARSKRKEIEWRRTLNGL